MTDHSTEGSHPLLVFVYGTLKKGFGNNVLLADAEFLGEAITADETYVMTGRGIPFVHLVPEDGHSIVGEVYNVTEPQLRSLDGLEGHPTWYERQEIPVILNYRAEGPHLLPDTIAWIYLMPGEFDIKHAESVDDNNRQTYRAAQGSGYGGHRW